MFPWKKGRLSMLLYFMKERYLRFCVAFFMTILAVFFGFMSPQIIKVTVDSVLDSEPFALPAGIAAFLEGLGGRQFLLDNLYLCGLSFVIMSLLSGVTGFLRGYLSGEAAEHAAKKFRDKLYDYIQRLPYKWHVDAQTGDIIQRCTSDLEQVKSFVGGQLVEVFRVAVLMTVALILMFSMDVQMTWIAVCLMPLIVGFSGVYYAKVGKHFKTADEAEGALSALVQENLTGVRVVRAFGRERFETGRFEEKNGRLAALSIKLYDLMSIYWSGGDVITGVQLLLVMVAGVMRCVQGNMTLGTFLVFYSYTHTLVWPVRNLGRMLAEMGKTGISLSRLREILSAEPETARPDDLTPEIRGHIRFEDVRFGYAENKVLKNLSFEIKPGQTLGVLGGTGSGKSTVAHLLLRLYDLPEGSGRITIDGVDIGRIDRAHLRSNVGLVLQEPFLFSRTVRQNIAAGNPEAELEEIRACAHSACVDGDIDGFAQKYDTVLGERGVTVSGGQKQRLAIARMLMQRTPVMIFDDSLSAVDAQTDLNIRNALLERAKQREATTIIISHRISTLMRADAIMVLKDGAVEEMGSHQQLYERGGIYRRICDLQNSITA